jgi:hypothetical protein
VVCRCQPPPLRQYADRTGSRALGGVDIRSLEVLPEDGLTRFQYHVEEVIERQDPFHISKDVGMFEACQSNAS